MALYTILNKAQLSQFAAHFNLPPPRSFKGILAGTVNTYYRLQYADGAYFLKVDEIGKSARLKRELVILNLLAKHSWKLKFETPTALTANGSRQFLPWTGKFILLFPEMRGKSLFGARLTPGHLKQVGAALARLHRATAKSKLAPHRFNAGELKRVFRQIKPKLQKKHPQLAPWVLNQVKTLTQNSSVRLPEGLIHADLFPENILFEGKKLKGILDFEAGGRGTFLFDLAVAIHACAHDGKKFILPKAKALLKGYESVRRLTPAERKNFSNALNESALRFLLTRLRDFELKDGPVKAKPFKDYREYTRRFAEIPALTKALFPNR